MDFHQTDIATPSMAGATRAARKSGWRRRRSSWQARRRTRNAGASAWGIFSSIADAAGGRLDGCRGRLAMLTRPGRACSLYLAGMVALLAWPAGGRPPAGHGIVRPGTPRVGHGGRPRAGGLGQPSRSGTGLSPAAWARESSGGWTSARDSRRTARHRRAHLLASPEQVDGLLRRLSATRWPTGCRTAVRAHRLSTPTRNITLTTRRCSTPRQASAA